MATEALVGEQLTEEMIAAGDQLMRGLDRLPFLVKGAFWFLLPEQRTWRLVIASPEVRTSGPKAAYRKVMAALKRIPSDSHGLDVKDVTVVGDKDPLVELISSLVKTSAGSSSRIRVTRNVVNGHFIDDMLVYRMT